MKNRQRGFSLIELLIVVAIILIIAAIAIPNLLRARISANEASAVSSLRTINTACITYNSTYGVYPTALSNLSPVGSGGTPSSTSADLLDQVLAPPVAGTLTSSKSGYNFTYAPGGSGAQNQTYTVEAWPVTALQTGIRYFFTDQSGVVRSNSNASATASSTPI